MALSNDVQRYIDQITARQTKIKADVIAKLGMVHTDTSNAKRAAMGEAAKQLKEYRALADALAKVFFICYSLARCAHSVMFL